MISKFESDLTPGSAVRHTNDCATKSSTNCPIYPEWILLPELFGQVYYLYKVCLVFIIIVFYSNFCLMQTM